MLTLVAVGFFIPGISQTMFTLDMEMLANLGSSSLTTELVNKELSIIGTVEELWHQERHLVSFLIMFFSIVLPMAKSLMVSTAYFSKNQQYQRKLLGFVTHIGKWSMADVLVVAIFLAVLSTNHANTASQHQLSMGLFQINFTLSSETFSSVGNGFWCFTLYCILSLAGSHLMFKSVNK